MSPHPREFAIQGKKSANPRGSAGGGGGGGGGARVELTRKSFSINASVSAYRLWI